MYNLDAKADKPLQTDGVNCRLQVAGCRLQVAGYRLQVAGCRSGFT